MSQNNPNPSMWPIAMIAVAFVMGMFLFTAGWIACEYYSQDSQEPTPPEKWALVNWYHGGDEGTLIYRNLDLHINFTLSETLIEQNFTINLPANVSIQENGTQLLQYTLAPGSHHLWHPRNTTSSCIVLSYQWDFVNNYGNPDWAKAIYLYWNDG